MIFFGKHNLSEVIVFGVGELTPVAVEFAKTKGIRVAVITGKRQADVRNTEGTSIVGCVGKLGTSVQIVEDLRQACPDLCQVSSHGRLGLSFGSPFIFKQEIIDAFESKIINSHGSPLPEWRGGGNFSWRIMAGDRRGNSCFHLVTEKIDAGDIVYQESYEFDEEIRFPKDYTRVAAERSRQALLVLLEQIWDGKDIPLQQQDPNHSTYFPRLNTVQQAWIDWSWPGEAVERFVLAFSHPYSGAKSTLNEKVVKIFDARFEKSAWEVHPFMYGMIIHVETDILVACNGGTLRFARDQMQSDGPLRNGDRLFTSNSVLEESFRIRPVYTPSGLKKVK